MRFIFLAFLIVPAIIYAERPQPTKPTRVIPRSYYTVVAPSAIRPDQPYNIHVRGFNLDRSIRIVIRIFGTSDAQDQVNIRRRATVSRGSSRVSITIDTYDITSGKYTLEVEGGGVKETRNLTFVGRRFSFIALLNKALFLPGDLVQYKIFAYDSETKAANPRIANEVEIIDPSGNKITSFQNVRFRKGSYKNELQLSNRASLGLWRIQARFGEENLIKEFEVAEYKLPLVQGNLLFPSTVTYSDGKVPVTVEVSYTFGGEASGNASVSFSSGRSQVFTKSVIIESGSVTFDVDFVNDLQLTTARNAYFNVVLVYEDPLTGTRVTSNKYLYIRRFSYQFFVRSDPVLISNSDFKFTITLRKLDGTPAPAGTIIQIGSQPSRRSGRRPIDSSLEIVQDQTGATNLTLDENGSVSSSVFVAAGVTYLSLRLTAHDAYEGRIYAYGREAVAGPYLNLQVLTETPKLNEDVRIKISSGELTDYVIIHIVSKGVLLKSTRLYFDDDSNEDNDLKTVIYKFKPTIDHIPQGRIIAYYIDKKGNFVVGQAFIDLANNFNNYLTITPKENDVKPGSEVDFDIESYQYSTVSLVAVDQRNLLLRTGGNITRDEVFSGLWKYTWHNTNFDYPDVAQYEYVFGSVGLFVITNIPRPPRELEKPERPSRPSERPEPSERAPSELERGTDSNGVKIRKDFRETFLWRDVDITHSKYDEYDYDNAYKGLETISEKVPESITTYVIYGISMSKYDGIGLSDIPSSLTIFMPFFLSVELPYSVKRNEVLVQDIVVFNFLRRGQTAEVRITKDPKYEGVDLTKYGWTESRTFYTQTVKTQANKNLKLQFALKPKVIGFIQFEVTIKGPLAGDGIKKPLRVVQDGVLRSITSSVLIATTSSSVSNGSLQCNIPSSAYQDTAEISATVVGDILGKTLENLDNLIRLPGGCGEQNMMGFAPNIAIYFYLEATGKLTDEIKTKISTYSAAGYLNQLRYQRSDGSFSAWGNSYPGNGSTSLTAYVGQYFYLAKGITYIDPSVITRAAQFVVNTQQSDGSFLENGKIFNFNTQIGSGRRVALSAHCSIFLSLISAEHSQFLEARDKSLTYLVSILNTELTTYELGVVAYALKLAGSSSANTAFLKFDDEKIELPIQISWGPALDVETTSFGLLTYIERNENLSTLIKIVKYIISRSNSNGGYQSTQDTVIAIYALSKFAKLFSPNGRVDLSLTPNIGNPFTARVDSSNALTVQSWNLNQNARRLNYVATSRGSSLAIVSLVCSFYDDLSKTTPAFEITYTPSRSCSYSISFEVCTKYIPSEPSGMVIMIVTLPSGYVYNQWAGNSNPNIARTETSNQGSKVTFYFDEITSNQECVRVNAYKAQHITQIRGGEVEVYNYYDPTKYGMISYPVPDTNSQCYYYR